MGELKLSNSKKSQIFSIDLMIAIVTLSIIILFIFWGWSESNMKMASQNEEYEMINFLIYSSESLSDTMGFPQNWSLLDSNFFNTSSVNSLGLITKDGLLSLSKVNKLVELNSTKYETIKLILGVPDYNFAFDLYIYNGSDFELDSSFGLKNTSSDIFKIQRLFANSSASKTWIKIDYFISK